MTVNLKEIERNGHLDPFQLQPDSRLIGDLLLLMFYCNRDASQLL